MRRSFARATGRQYLHANFRGFLRQLPTDIAEAHNAQRLPFNPPQRRAVLLVAGDKAGNWTRWYRDAIKLAEDRYARYLATPPEEIR